MVYEKIKKHLNYLFLNVNPNCNVGEEVWARVGKATEWTDTMNAITTTYEYIEDSAPTDVIESYQPSTSIPLTAYVEEPVYEYIFDLYQNQDVSSNSVTKCMRVFQNKVGQTAYKAQVSNVSVILDDFDFATGVIKFELKQSGTPIIGSATVVESQDEFGNRIWTPSFSVVA